MNIFKKNRNKIIKSFSSGLIFLSSSEEKIRNSDVHYKFRQDSDFYYLTGVEIPETSILIDCKNKKSYLFIPDINLLHQIWIGKQLTANEAMKRYKFDFVHYNSEFKNIFHALQKKNKKIFSLPRDKKKINKLISPKKLDQSELRLVLNELRVRKEKEEIDFILKANKISLKGHVTAMKAAKNSTFEHEVQAALEGECLKAGCQHMAYGSIVAGGKNAAILHYVENNAKLKKTDLMLIDAGCEYNHFASDITRTFPISGKFSKKQSEIYSIALDTQKSCIKMVKPGVSIFDIHNHACEEITKGLKALGIFKDLPIKDIIKSQTHRIFFPHGIGHMLGLDVHDVGGIDPKHAKKKVRNLRAARKLEPGFVLTIEPGIYFIKAHFEDKDLHKQTEKYINWKKAKSYYSVGGIRIEDNILVTKTGYRNLTSVPKEIAEIEKVMRE